MPLYSQQLICNQVINKYPNTSWTCRYTTVWNISRTIQLSYRPKTRQRRSKRARTEENATVVDELVLSQEDHQAYVL